MLEPESTGEDIASVKQGFQQAAAACISLSQRQEYLGVKRIQKITEDLQGTLERIWSSLCKIYAAGIEGWTVDKGGYLIRKTSACSVLVPYHLADYFPTGDSLEALCNLAFDLKVMPEGVICISGSATFLEAVQYTSDIDYCEYVPFDKNEKWSHKFVDALYQAVEKQSDTLVCLKAMAFHPVHTEHLDQGRGNYEVLKNLILSRARLDFLTHFLEDVTEATNLVLPVDIAKPDDSTLQQSFAAQEVPVVEGTWIPQKLLDPISLGHYAIWLQEEVKKEQATDPIKAARRALSLSRITGFWEEGDMIINILTETNAVRYAAFKARSALEPHVKQLHTSNPEISRAFLEGLKKTLQKLSLGNDVQELGDDNIEALRRVIEQLFDKIQKKVVEFGGEA